MTCEQAKALFVEAYYNELDGTGRTSFDAHLASCTGCSAAYRELTKTLKLMDQRATIEPAGADPSKYWESLKLKIESDSTLPATRLLKLDKRARFVSPWAYGIAAMILIGIGMYLGRALFTGNTGERGRSIAETGVSSVVKPDSLTADEVNKEMDAYLDRTKALLLGLINAPVDNTSPATFAKQQEVSRNLIRQADILEAKLTEPDRERFKQLIGDLGIILRELANYSAESGVPLIELVKQGVDKKSIILKINLEQIRALDAKMKPRESAKKNDHKSKI